MYINDLQKKLKKAHLEMHTLAREEEHLIDQFYRLNKIDGWWEKYDNHDRWDTLVDIKTRINEIHDEINLIREDIQWEHTDSYENNTDIANEEVFHDDFILEIHFHHAPTENPTRDCHDHR